MNGQIRDAKGHFLKGNPGGPGRRLARNEEHRLAILQQEVDDATWRAICRAAIYDATKGNDGITREKGRRWISDYILGKPAQTVTIKTAPPDPFEEFDGFTDEQLRAIADGRNGDGDIGSEGREGGAGGATGTGAPSSD